MPGTTPGPAATTPPIPFNRPTLVGGELDYVRRAVEGGHTSAAGPFLQTGGRPAAGSPRRRRRHPDHLLHRRPRDGRPAARPPARGHDHRALLHFREHRPGLRPGRLRPRVRRHRTTPPRPRRGARGLPGGSRTPGRSSRSTTGGSPPTCPGWSGPPETAPSTCSRTTPTASSPPSVTAPWAPSGAWPPSRSTRRRTSPAGKAGP